MSARRPLLLLLVASVPVVALLGASRFAVRDWNEEISEPVSIDPDAWATSETCHSCHPDQHASWARTFHRTMTQEATPEAVRGEFDGREVTYQGRTIRPVRRGDRFFFQYLDPVTLEVARELEIERTVGSRRYQQYLARTPETGQNFYRLHLLWHILDERWVHMNGAFLGPDGQAFDANVSVWNHGCVFCHNTGPEPGSTNYDSMVARARDGVQVDFLNEARYDTDVAELGIACESCHGPGDVHSDRNRNPLRRYLLATTGASDPTIVDPEELSKERSAEICGQCHGQRVPIDMDVFEEWITTGPSYRAGAVLDRHVEPIFSHTTAFVGPDQDRFRLRFWGDGTPRLTAYEYQGLLQSPCFQKGDLTCIDCHSMHGGDPRGQIEPRMRTDAACRDCHADLVAQPTEHSKHPESQLTCYDCHMPKMVYGIMEIHRSHRIENPAPATQAALGRPDACTNCHLDRSPLWAERELARLWGRPPERLATRGDGAAPELVSSTASLLAGDPVQRAVAARLAGRPDAAEEVRARAFLVPLLLLALDDDYPAVRRFAHGSLRSLTEQLRSTGYPLDLAGPLEDFDFLAERSERDVVLSRLARAWAASPREDLPSPPEGSLLRDDYLPDLEGVTELRALARRSDKRIDIGE